jgi:DNA processing protein
VSDALAVYRLSQVPGVGATRINRLLALARDFNCTLQDVLDTPGESDSLLTDDQRAFLNSLDGREEVEGLDEMGIELLVASDGRYPPLLRERLDDRCPPLLFCHGDARLLSGPAVAIAGSRQASARSLDCARDTAGHAVEANRVVVSGYAGGVDTAAHAAALVAGGATVLVLAEGLLRFRQKEALREVIDGGSLAIVSQFLPRTGWSTSNAMQRNQTICALAEAVFVIEAGETGGSLAAGRAALQLGVPLFVPAHPEPLPPGNRILLKEGGRPLPVGEWKMDQLLAELGDDPYA